MRCQTEYPETGRQAWAAVFPSRRNPGAGAADLGRSRAVSAAFCRVPAGKLYLFDGDDQGTDGKGIR